MSRQRKLNNTSRITPNRLQHTNAVALAKRAKHDAPFSKRARIEERNQQLPFMPPENWYEPSEGVGLARNGRYKFVVQKPGEGFRHVLTTEDVRQRLAGLPEHFIKPLEVVQFSQMTRKKQSFPCYGMQWGSSIYLYPIEENLVEYYTQPPKPNQVNEARMYGGQWTQESPGTWKLMWTEAAIRDFYLNNILIHELGHLLDNRNSGYKDRERFAEWFALAYGYKPSRRFFRAPRAIERRHHCKS